MSQEDGALSTDVKEEPTEKIRSKYVHPSPEKNEITPLNKEESNKDNNKSYQNQSKKSSGWWEDFLSYELGEHIQEYTKVTYPDVLTDDGEPISVEIENHSFSKPPHAHKYAIHPNVPWKGQWDQWGYDKAEMFISWSNSCSKTIFIFEIYRRKTCSVYLLKYFVHKT